MLLVLHPFKFINHYYYEYELDIYKKKFSSKIEIHDLSNIVNPGWDFAFKGQVHKNAKVFKNLNNWKKYFKNLINREKKVIILNNLDVNSLNSFFVHYEIFKSKKNLIQYRSPSLSLVKEDQKFIFYPKKLSEVFHPRKFNLKKIIFFIKTKILGILIFFLKFEKIYILFSGKKKNFRLLLKAKKNIFINIHSKDYSKFLLQKKRDKKKYKGKKFAVFLDLPGPYFPNDFFLFGYKVNHNVKKWYSDLNIYLKQIEKTLNIKIVIIPHPKVRQVKNPMYDKSFKVVKDVQATSKLIPNCQFVLSIAGSTSVSFAVSNLKRIILLYNNQIIKNQKIIYLHTKNMSEELDASFVNIKDKFKKSMIMKKINLKKYKKYKADYLTIKKISNLMNFQIIKKIL